MIPVTLDTVPYLVAPDTFLIPTFAAEPSGAYFGAHSLVIRGSRAGHRRHRLFARPRAVARADLQRRRPGRRPLGVPVARRPRPHRQPRRRARDVPERHPRVQLPDRRPPHGRRRTAARADALGRPRPDASTSATARCRSCARRCSTRRRRADSSTRRPACSGPSTRSARSSPARSYEAGDIPTDLYDGSFAALNGWNTPWLELVDAERFAAHVAKTSQAATRGRRQRARPDPPRRPDRRRVPPHARPRRTTDPAGARPGNPRPARLVVVRSGGLTRCHLKGL